MKKFPYKAALFDMDGVVVDTNREVTSFWNAIASSCREPISLEEFDHYVYGCQAEYTLDKLFPFITGEMRLSVLKEMKVSEKNAVYNEISGFRQFISILKSNNMTTALVTSGLPYKVEVVLGQLQLLNIFDQITTAKDICKSKPDPQCYLLTAESLNVQPKDCIVFEDAISGVKAAVSAGADCIGINRKKEMLIQAGAKAVFDDFTDEQLLCLFLN